MAKTLDPFRLLLIAVAGWMNYEHQQVAYLREENRVLSKNSECSPRCSETGLRSSQRNRHAVRKMEVGPPEPSCRRRLQTALSCFGLTAAVVNVRVKRRGIRSRHVGIR